MLALAGAGFLAFFALGGGIGANSGKVWAIFGELEGVGTWGSY